MRRGFLERLLTAGFKDMLAATAQAGDLLIYAAGKWQRLAKGTTGFFVRAAAATVEYVELAFSMIVGVITDTQHGSRAAGLHADSHARQHALSSGDDHSGALAAGQHGTLADGDHSGNLSGIARTTVRKNTGANVGSRRRLNLIEGANVTLTVADDAADEEVDVTIVAAAGEAGVQVLDAQTATVDVVNTTVETDLYSYSVAGGTLGVNKGLRLLLHGDYFNNTAAAATIRLRIYFGATVIGDTGSLAGPAVGTTRRAMTVEVNLLAKGATNAQTMNAKVRIEALASAAGVLTDGLAPARARYGIHNAIAEDSAAAQVLRVTFLHGTADALISAQRLNVRLEKLQ